MGTLVIEKNGVRARQAAATRMKILQAALDLFAEKGFEGASLRDIAARAGVIHGLIKYHFKNKNELWKSAVDYLFERQAEEMASPPGFMALPPYERFRNWIKRYVHYCARHPEHARIMVQESMRDSERLRWAVRKHIIPAHESARADSIDYKDAEVFPNISTRSIIYIMFAAAQSPFMLSAEIALAEGVDVSDENEIEKYAEELCTFFLDHKSRRRPK